MTDSTSTATYPQRTFRDRMRIDNYLLRLDWHLEGMLPSAERKAALRSLREELATDTRDVTVALSDLGPPGVLASRYADEGTRRPLWSIGVIIAAVALLAYWAVFLSFTGGMLAAVDSIAPASAQSRFLFIHVEAFSSAEGFGIGWTSGWAWLVVPTIIVAIAFLLGARVWRWRRSSR